MLRSLAVALLVLDFGYCVAATLIPELPGWKMFASQERSSATLHAADGHVIDAYAWVPKSARDLDDADVRQIAHWLCLRHPDLAPLRFDSGSVHRGFGALDCVDRAAD